MTLAMLVAVMTASNSRKLPKVNWPIESENDRARRTIAAKGMGFGTGSEQSAFIRWNLSEGEHACAVVTATGRRRQDSYPAESAAAHGQRAMATSGRQPPVVEFNPL
jgi:hypothetical protein